MDDNQRLKLNSMIKENNVEDNTELIRELKHSHILRAETDKILELKREIEDSNLLFAQLSIDCNFMFTYYTDILNKLRKDELNVELWYRALNILKQIEDGELDQHEASYNFGTIMKEIYIDSALKKAEKLDEPKEEVVPQVSSSLSWSTYKRMRKYGAKV